MTTKKPTQAVASEDKQSEVNPASSQSFEVRTREVIAKALRVLAAEIEAGDCKLLNYSMDSGLVPAISPDEFASLTGFFEVNLKLDRKPQSQ